MIIADTKIAIGPMIGLPSTDWVGKDIGEEIHKKYSNVTFFEEFSESLAADVVLIIKVMPPISWILGMKAKGIRLIYIPVDIFFSPYKITKHREKLKQFDALCIHNSRLANLLGKYNYNIYFIDHYLKYHLEPTPEFKADGFILWVGHLEYLPALVIKLKNNSISKELLVLADLEKLVHYRKGMQIELATANIPWSETQHSDGSYTICGIKVKQWSEQSQEKALQECKAAFDTKANSFAHNLKPPTKAQKYIYNNIPFATDCYSYSSQYFKERGLIIPTLEETDRWLSKEYFNEIKEYNSHFKYQVEKAYVANCYLKIVNNVLNTPIKPNSEKSIFKDNVNSKLALLHKIKLKIFSLLIF
ncbi:hypothetical protein [Paraglaciecola sp.]|uniref:hypothetical protein n=1 Tax=Paraglaciecola sp. TaxID=1920173 RepID=UPI00273E1BA5|nr:hypothetical protein [Paraglaciecola sp.]MDP5030984.1 hypothetical protein [Paraglaciecola sp.]